MIVKFQVFLILSKGFNGSDSLYHFHEAAKVQVEKDSALPAAVSWVSFLSKERHGVTKPHVVV